MEKEKENDCCGKEDCCNDENCCGEHNHEQNHDPSNPFANLDEQTQKQIQELQMLEQGFQQLLMQKNTFSMENNESELIISEVEKSEGEIFRIIGGQVAIKSTKEKINEEMKRKKELLEKRLESIEKQEKEYSKKIEDLRDEILKKIQG